MRNASLNDSGSTWTIVVAAGSGTRFGGEVPKQFVVVADRRILDWSVATAAAVSDGVVVVMPPQGDHVEPSLPEDCSTKLICVPGGASRSASVRCGLARVPVEAAVVLVHDAARPVASTELFERVVQAVRGGADGVVPAVPVVDTLRTVDGEPVDRSRLEAVQTPQGFAASALRRAHAADADATDDATLVAEIGGRVVTMPGERWNLKVTDPTDELIVDTLLRSERAAR